MRDALQILLSDDTISRILDKVGLKHWRAAKRPALTKELAQIRLKWAKEHVSWTQEQWDNIILSDECSVERGSGVRRVWVWRTPQQKWDKEMIIPHKKGKDISIMVWAAIWGVERSELIVMERDDHSPREGYSANSYIKVLEDAIPTCWQPGLTFMQDNARIHTAKKVVEWFKE